jgi:TolB-like protein/DNA-binding winged helix-turn-helix (wHTH) protein/Tfp pilus assembly protein PilF
MAEQTQKPAVRFGVFEASLTSGELRKNGLLIRMPGQPFKILAIFLERPAEVVTRDELRRSLWPAETFVDFEHSLNSAIKKLRKALGDSAETPRYIETLPRLGYRFIAPVISVRPEAAAEPAAQPAHVSEVRTITEPESVIPEGPTGVMSQPAPGVETSRRYRRIGSLAVAVAITLLLWLAWARFNPRRPQVPGRVMLAVLPFQNLSGDPEQEYFADGLTEEMITQLGWLQPQRLGVIARTSVMTYKHSEKRLDQIGRELSVQYVLEGSFRRDADRLRIAAQLIQVKDQSHLWAEEYDRWPKDLVDVQGEVAVAIAQEIQLQLSPQQKAELNRSRPLDPQIHEEYLKGRFFYNQRTAESIRKAIGHLQMAIAHDPAYGEAYESLAAVYTSLGLYLYDAPNEVLPKAKAAALMALAIDDRASEAYAVLGEVSMVYDRNWTESERNFRRAIEVNPNEPIAHHEYGSQYLAAVGRFDEALAELREAHELDPLSPITTVAEGATLCFIGKSDDCMEQFRRTFEIAPHFLQAHYYLSQAYGWRGSYPEALAELDKIGSPDDVPVMGQRGYVYAAQGRARDALLVVNQLERLSKRGYVDPVFIANIYAGLGDRESSFLWLERAYDQHSEGMLTLKESPVYNKIRFDPRFADLLRRVGIP